MAAPEIPSVKISRSLKLTDHRIALGHDHHTKENAEKAGADTKGPNVQRVGGSRLSGAAGYSSATMSSFGPRLSLGFPPTRLGARRFGADDWGMQSQRIGHTQKATKPKSGKLRSESGKKRTDLTQPPRRPESPYLSRPFSQPNTRPVSRETHTSGNLKAPASLSRPPSTPTTRGKTKTTRRPSTKWGGTTPRSGDVSLRPSTSRGEASAKEIRTFTNIDACGDGGGFFSTKGKRPPSAQDAHIEENAFGESRRRDPIQEVDPPSLHERDAVALPTETEGEESGGLADSYGMTLGEYISNMRTTPALGSSFSGLQSERWASIPMDSSDLVDGDSDGEIEIVEDVESLSDTSEQFNGFGEVEKPEPGTPRPHTHSSSATSASPPPHDEKEEGTKFRSAMWNGFDLRPATAFQAPSFTKSTIEDSHEIGDTKEVDLGSLAAQLFSASPEKEQMSRKANEVSAASEPRLKRPESANLWTRSSRRPMSCHSDDGSQQNIRSSRASSQGTGKSGDTGRQEMTLQSSTTQGPLVSSRKAHSARPAKRVEPNLDPSAWQPALGAKRPPSRQKPPPEALHLFSPQSFVNVHNGAAQRRPKTTMAITRRPTRPPSGPSVHESPSSTRPTAPRPPSRQKPPPESLGLGQAKGRPSKTYRQIFVSDSDDETLGHLSPQTHQSSTPEISDG